MPTEDELKEEAKWVAKTTNISFEEALTMVQRGARLMDEEPDWVKKNKDKHLDLEFN